MVLLIFGFLLGLAVGSFLNVVILRGARGNKFPRKSATAPAGAPREAGSALIRDMREAHIFSGRSRCESCGKTLSWHELIPILSFCLQKGRCRSCGAALSWQYPLVELGTGLAYAFALWYLFSATSPSIVVPLLLVVSRWLLVLIIFSSSLVIFVSDLRWRIIPNGAVLVLLLSGIAIRLTIVFDVGHSPFAIGYLPFAFLWDFGAAVVIALFFAAIWFITKGRGMGFGDAKLVLATSLVLGFPESVVAVLLAFWIGAAAGILLILFRLKTWKDQIPFGPYILIGAALAYLFTEEFLLFFGSI